jgi:hypothetical protein
MKTKQEMIQEILSKYNGLLTAHDLEDFELSLNNQDEVSVWETYTKNGGVDETDAL